MTKTRKKPQRETAAKTKTPIAAEQPAAFHQSRALVARVQHARAWKKPRKRKPSAVGALRFLSISASNLDEFYMVRVAGLHEQVKAGASVLSLDGLTPAEQLGAHSRIGCSPNCSKRQQDRWRKLRAEMRGSRHCGARSRRTDAEERVLSLKMLFMAEVFPLLTPLAVDPAHPFPFIPNLGFAIALKLKRKGDGRTLNALIPVPTQVARFIDVTLAHPQTDLAPKANGRSAAF